MPGFYDRPPYDEPPGLPFRPPFGDGWYRPAPKPELVESLQGQQADARYRPGEPSGGDAVPAAFSPGRGGVWNVAGLAIMAEPGTTSVRTPVPTAGGYEPAVASARSSRVAEFIRPTLHVALNRRLLGVRSGWHKAPVPALAAPRLERGNPRHQMLPQPIFPGRATDWPRAVPRYKTFGEP